MESAYGDQYRIFCLNVMRNYSELIHSIHEEKLLLYVTRNIHEVLNFELLIQIKIHCTVISQLNEKTERGKIERKCQWLGTGDFSELWI